MSGVNVTIWEEFSLNLSKLEVVRLITKTAIDQEKLLAGQVTANCSVLGELSLLRPGLSKQLCYHHYHYT